MYAMNGYIEDNRIVVGESIADFDGHNVIITVLDSVQEGISKLQHISRNDRAMKAAMSISGLWADRDEESVEETVRTMRKGRSFDY